MFHQTIFPILVLRDKGRVPLRARLPTEEGGKAWGQRAVGRERVSRTLERREKQVRSNTCRWDNLGERITRDDGRYGRGKLPGLFFCVSLLLPCTLACLHRDHT